MREPTRGRTDVGARRVANVDAERLERRVELVAAARDEALAGAHFERRVAGDELAALFDAPFAAPHLPGENHALRASSRLGEPALDDEQIRSLSSLNVGGAQWAPLGRQA
jgi:hypothetical protein